MGWRTPSVTEERLRFVVLASRDEKSMTALCQEFGISRPTGYTWLILGGRLKPETTLAVRSFDIESWVDNACLEILPDPLVLPAVIGTTNSGPLGVHAAAERVPIVAINCLSECESLSAV